MRQDENDKSCPVCGKHYFDEMNAYEMCPICGWFDDLLQRLDSDYSTGYNEISVNDAKKKFASGKKVFD